MRILILGGTVFLGRALTESALARGHDVTHLNRGKTSPGDLRVKSLLADRTDARAFVDAIGERSWDAVVDTSCYLPQVARISTEALRGRVGRYLFVSTISVYPRFQEGMDEDAPVSPPPDPLPDTMKMELYGPLKSACEIVVRESWRERATLVRPGLIVGPHDPTDRFTWWPVRVARGGQVLAPGSPERAVQFIDVRDLAEWMVMLVEGDTAGTFNATGPARELSMSALLGACAAAAESDARFQWIPDEALLAAGAGPWIELPLWIPESDASMGRLMAISTKRARAAGLTFRPLAATVRDTLDWALARPAGHAWKAGMSVEREREVMRLLRNLC